MQVIRQCKMRARSMQPPTTRERTTARCLTFSFATSLRNDLVSGEATERMSDMKKVDMGKAAERLLASTDWLPSWLRTVEAQE